MEDSRRNFNNFNFSFLFNVIYFLKRFIFLKGIKNEIYTYVYIQSWNETGKLIRETKLVVLQKIENNDKFENYKLITQNKYVNSGIRV